MRKMNKIKINKKVEKSIIYRVNLLEKEGFTPEEFTNIFIKKYKMNNKDNNIFTTEETDAIIQLLHRFGDFFEETLGFQLYVSYIMLSIINPELFEETNND